MNKIALAIALWLGSTTAQAATMTFSNLPVDDVRTLVEDGITASAVGFYPFLPHGTGIHLDDCCASWPSAVTFTMETRFDALRFDLFGQGVAYIETILSPREINSLIYDNVGVYGYRDGAEVASLEFYGNPALRAIFLGPSFVDLDTLVIAALVPSIWGQVTLPDGRTAQYDCGFNPCGHFNIDNVTLAPVPVPTALPLLGAALAGLGFIGWTRKRVR